MVLKDGIRAWTAGWTATCRPTPIFRLLEAVEECIFSYSWRVNDMECAIGEPSFSRGTPVESYHCVSMGTNKNSSACVQVWTTTCRPNGLFCLPKGLVGGKNKILGQVVGVDNSMSLNNLNRTSLSLSSYGFFVTLK